MIDRTELPRELRPFVDESGRITRWPSRYKVQRMAATLLAIEQFSLGLEYLDRYPDFIARITRDDVLAATDQYLDPSRLATGVARPA